MVLATLTCFATSVSGQQSELQQVESNLRNVNTQFATANVLVIRELTSEQLPGLYEVTIDGQSLIVNKAGTRAIAGEVYDLQNMLNLTKAEKQKGQLVVVKQEIAKLNKQDFVTYPATDETIGKMYVFTDTTCGYCKKLHKEIKDYQTAGIEVNYIPYPRSQLLDGNVPYEKMKQVMCAKDKLDAMTKIKAGTDNDEFVKDSYNSACIESVKRGQLAGINVGLEGTPFIYLSDAKVQIIAGYQPSSAIINLFQK